MKTIPKIPCPNCQHYESKVITARGGEAQGGFHRKRQCLKCGARYLTIEQFVRRVKAARSSTTHNIW
jgi:transcriptional regulator NrdR family protein